MGGTLRGNEKYDYYITKPGKITNTDGSVYDYRVANYKPFLPGQHGLEYNAGVDEMGFLLGAIAMTDIYNKVEFENGKKIGESFDNYNQFKAKSPGIDSEGLGTGGPMYCGGTGLSSIYSSSSIPVTDIERMTALIPFDEIKVGDIVIMYGTASEYVRNVSHVGIVVSVPKGDVTLSDILAKTKIVHISQKLGQVRLDTLNNFEVNNTFTVRRLLATSHGDITERPKKSSDWDVLDMTPSILSVSIDKPKSWERWIPNTGEYFEFKLNPVLTNTTGNQIDLATVLGDSVYLRINPPVDRKILDASDFDAASNIINNKGTGFEVVIKPENGFDQEAAIPVIVFTLNMTTGLYEPDTQSSKLFKGSGANIIPASTSSSERLTIVGNSIQYHGKECTFGIRPLSSKICPGDDLYLSVGIYKNTGGTVTQIASCAVVGEEDYLAVYDKKMLWRANLYIDEGGKNDWNNTHPWNAPPSTNARPNDQNPSWGKNADGSWDEAWGYNEWNRTPKRFVNGVETDLPDESRYYPGGLSHWIVGNGKQVINIAPFTPIRPQVAKENGHYPATNLVSGKEAYDYPVTSADIFSPTDSMDSPFMFNKKMVDQKDNILNGETITNTWPPVGFTINQMNQWLITTAPGNCWNNYRKNPVNGNYPALPGLGLLFHLPANGNNEDPLPNFPTNLAQDSLIHAGTDCLGFTQRSSSYYGRDYLFPAYAEAVWGDDEVTKGTGSRHLLQIDCWTDEYKALLTKSQYNNAGIPLAALKKFALHVVPGDIFFIAGHIGIVADMGRLITTDTSTKLQVLATVDLIESTYGARTCYIRKSVFSEFVGASGWAIVRLAK